MGLVSRFQMIVAAKFSKLLDRAENPDETLDYSYEKQVEMLQGVKRGIADVVTAKKRLELQQGTLTRSTETLETQSRYALSIGREDIARLALERRSAAQTQLSSLDEQIGQLEHQRDHLIESEKALRTKIERFRSEKEVLKAQYSAAKAHVAIQEAAAGLGSEFSEVGLAIDRARDRTQNMMARANAIEELAAAGALEDFSRPGDELERELARLTSGAEVEGELARLRAELGQTKRQELTRAATD